MKSTGIVRSIDALGRVVLPMELRRVLNIDKNTPLEIYTEGDNIVLRKYQCNCVICGSNDNLKKYKGKTICTDCIENLKLV